MTDSVRHTWNDEQRGKLTALHFVREEPLLQMNEVCPWKKV